MKKAMIFPFLLLAIVCTAGLFFNPTEMAITTEANAADIAWMLTASSLVLLMTPGLSFFLWRHGE